MGRQLSSYTGCLLGLAAGDGLGHGPERVNGFLSISAYTQMAAYGCNGLLLGMTRGQLTGAMAPPVRYIAQALGEWTDGQLWRRSRGRCWLSRAGGLDYHRCSEPEILDLLGTGRPGTMEEHQVRLSGPGALMTAVAVALFFDPERLERRELHRLGAEAAALTHGDPAAFLSAAALTHILSRILWDSEKNLENLCDEAGAMLRSRFGREYHQSWQVRRALRPGHRARPDGSARNTLAHALSCCRRGGSPEQILARAAEFSPACAAVAGAIAGALHGDGALPESWCRELECADVLRELAEDMYRGCPMTGSILDLEWDEKYNAGETKGVLYKKTWDFS